MMRIGGVLLLSILLLQDAQSFAPVGMRTSTRISSSVLAAAHDDNDWMKDCKTAMAGIAVGCMLLVSPAASFAASDSTMNLAAGFGSSYETLDFSLPSYDDSKSSSAPKKDAPSFNPFGDFEPSIKLPTAAPAEDPAEKAAKEAEAAEKAAAKEQAKADAEAKRAAERAEREARKAEQQAAAEAARAEKEAQKAAATPAAVESIELPDVKLPDVKLPDVKIPDVKLPDVKIPEISVPDVKLPEFNVPEFNVPKFTAPKLPSSFKMPEISVPDSISTPKLPSSANVPEVTMPDMPKISLPAFSNPFAGAGGDADSSDLSTPQTVRDEAAKAARLNYLDADKLAKEAEAQARQVRDAANAQKKAAAVAKDQACATRPGGKFICLRNPFNAGY